MITWLRRLMRSNAWIGMPPAAAYLLFLFCLRSKKRILGAALLSLAILWPAMDHFCASTFRAFAPRTYTITDLGALPEGDGESWAFGINDSGQVVGGSMGSSHQPHAFLWHKGVMTDLGVGAGVASSAAHISNSGLIAGSLFDTTNICHAAIWRNGKPEVLSLPENVSRGASVNDAGQMVGSMGFGVSFDEQAFLWRQGDSKKIGDFIAHDIDPYGTVVGFVATQRYFEAVVYQDGERHTLDMGGYDESAAFAINTRGQIAGYCGEWMEEQAALWEGGKLHLLGKLGNGSAQALALNDRGQVVGDSAMGHRVYHAFLWQEGAMQDLNNLLPPRSSWLLTRANGINARGQIVGEGRFQGHRRAFLLTPSAR